MSFASNFHVIASTAALLAILTWGSFIVFKQGKPIPRPGRAHTLHHIHVRCWPGRADYHFCVRSQRHADYLGWCYRADRCNRYPGRLILMLSNLTILS